MISPEVAQAELQKLKDTQQKANLLGQVPKLNSNNLQEITYKVLGYDENGQALDWLRIQETQARTLEKLNQLNESDRLTFFRLFFPKFAPTVEQAWQLFPHLPYQASYYRRGFRVPHHPEITQAKRATWLLQLVQTLDGYDVDLPWLAAWTPYLGYYGADVVGILFAAAINQGEALGEEVFSILVASARGEHEIGAMGRHVTRALLIASRPEGWEFIENLLVAAQRQEGLRQVILETIDEAHPEAFARMLKLIVTQDLTRFSATIRAVAVWFGLGWESVNHRLVKDILGQISLFLEQEDLQQAALESSDAQTVYLALWTIAFQDGFAAIPIARQFLTHPSVEHRFVAVYLLAQLDLPASQLALIPFLEDGDLRVATLALNNFVTPQQEDIQVTNLWEILASTLSRFPDKPKELKYLVWEWVSLKPAKSLVASAMLNNLGTRSPKLLIPYLSTLGVYERQRLAKMLADIKPWDEEIRETLFSLVGDASQWVRQEVISVISDSKVTETEIIALEKLLTRKSPDLRRGILQLILHQSPENIFDCSQRLLASKQALQRQAGLELLREMKAQGLCLDKCIQSVKDYQTQRKTLTESETQLIEFILEVESEEPTLEDGLGLINTSQLTPYVVPEVKGNYLLVTEATRACLQSLDELIEQHKHFPISISRHDQVEEELLANCHWFPYPEAQKTPEENLARLPLAEVWQAWEQARTESERDEDGLEFVRGAGAFYVSFQTNNFFAQVARQDWIKKAQQTLFIDTSSLRYPRIIGSILSWLIYLSPPQNIIDFLLDAVAQTLLLIPRQETENSSQLLTSSWEINNALLGWIQFLTYYRPFSISQWNNGQHLRYWQLMRHLEQFPTLSYTYRGSRLEDLSIVYRSGGATEADILAHLLAWHNKNLNPLEPGLNRNFNDLSIVTSRKYPPNLDPIFQELGNRCRQRILEVELQRGDLPTEASLPALALRSVEGIAILIQLLQSLGKEKLIRGYIYNNFSKNAVFSHLIRISFPAPSETPQDFAQEVKKAKIAEQQLIELAFYAPQWSNYVEYALGWPNLTEGIWWIHAHTKDNSWFIDAEVRESWKVQVSEQTPLSDQNLIDGAVDVDWFLRIYPDLKGNHWQKLYEASKYASSGAGHKRAQLFAEAMLGEIDRETLVNRINQKRNQDAVRAIGLLPLQGEADLLLRYQILQEFLRTSRQFGSQRQASEKLAVMIGMENLARTAKYSDPQRLEWAMEAKAIADLVKQPQTVMLEEISVSLSIQEGQPEISILKQGKPLKSIPTKYKKDPQISELQKRKQEITRQEKRMRLSLEEAMGRGDSFTLGEFQQLCEHPILAHSLEQLIFVGEQDIGYPREKGKSLRLYDGTVQPIRSDSLKIAHPYDLLNTQAWYLWQEDCFNRQTSQPYKQVFRELYLLTPTEISNLSLSRRYEGHQVNPRQALALWGQRGWISCPEEGVRKTFYGANLSVWVTFQSGFYTPLEMEGLTLESVYFTKRSDWKPLHLNDIPPLIFSEVMRDIDLVVSVAHLGGVDPEASASTLEMRSSLIRESCRLLKLDNVNLQGSYALIKGHLGSYSIHLGSGTVHRQPGGVLCIIPVHSQHRGRLFLPFADNDPKTAEVMSKVILLAKDKDIKDPTILEQIL